MKKRIGISIVAICVMMLGNVSFAQSNNGQSQTREQLAETQAKHIATEMNMDKATAKKFTETYCQYQNELWAIRPAERQYRNRATTDEEAERIIKQRFEHSRKILDLREKYYGIYRKFLTPLQIQRVYNLEQSMADRISRNGYGNRNGNGTGYGRGNGAGQGRGYGNGAGQGRGQGYWNNGR